MNLLNKFLGYTNQKVINTLQKQIDSVTSFEADLQKLTNKELSSKTLEFKERISQAKGDIEKEKEILNELLPEAYAVMREAMKRVWGERHFDVQVIGGIVLHQGKIAEMKTGEGKTIVAVLPLYLNALAGRGAHLVTVNDYLAKHHGEGMGHVFDFLGLSVGVIQGNQISHRFKKIKDYGHYSQCDGSNLEPCTRREAYACDITYGTNNEFGFDYLRDNMAPSLEYCVQRGLNYAIVDEVDSILIDEARTPLIISSAAEESAGMYQQFAALVTKLKLDEDYTVDEKDHAVMLTDQGIKNVEGLLGVKNIYAENGIASVHHLEQALKAHALFKKDKDYVVKDGEILIVDEFTGRLMVGRRYSEGLHQAIEAKEGVEVKRETQTMATISFQNLFRIYNKLSGMTGTAATEAEEFYKIYKLDVVEIPTNKPVKRVDLPDRIYKNEMAKFDAIVSEVNERQQKGQPVLVGTISVEKNELLSRMFKKAGIKHSVLNAKNHESEAKIIANAGLPGAVTIATNMAGRGTDIKLTNEVVEIGGLLVIGTERHESRRIDNQLRGRAGRQGDSGASQFYVSMDDDLMRIFGGEKMKKLMESLGLPDDMPIENKMISRSIESAQRRVEGHNFDIRKNLVEYDDVMNKHREVIYKKRRAILESVQEKSEKIPSLDNSDAESKDGDKVDLKQEILDIFDEQIDSILLINTEDREKTELELKMILGETNIPSFDAEILKEQVKKMYQSREEKYGQTVMRNIERAIFLRTIDMLWVEHLTTMDNLRTGIGLQGYGQRDPIVEYKQRAYLLFTDLLKNIERNIAQTIFKVEIQVAPQLPVESKPLEYHASDENQIGDIDRDVEEIKEEKEATSDVTTVLRQRGRSVYERMSDSAGSVTTQKNNHKVGRNDPCPCGSGKKYKKCCGKS